MGKRGQVAASAFRDLLTIVVVLTRDIAGGVIAQLWRRAGKHLGSPVLGAIAETGLRHRLMS
jgi:hypothetical protein